MTDYKHSCIKMIKEFVFSNEKDVIDLENIKSVCEVLLRTASTYSSDEEVMPPIDVVEVKCKFFFNLTHLFEEFAVF